MTEIDNRKFKYCILRSNTKLKDLIRLQIKRKQTSLAEVCSRKNLNYNLLLAYMNTPFFDSYGKPYASQKDVVALALSVGIDVGLSFKVK